MTTKPKDVRDAYYSTTGAAQCGRAVWADAEGEQVEVTEVTKVGAKPTSTWPDLEYKGRVVRLVSTTIDAGQLRSP